MKILSNKNNNSKKNLNTSRGMTLVELIVVLAIFMIVAGLTIFDYGRFRSSVSLQNLGDDIALSVRRAQNYAIGVHSSQLAVFSYGYGIHFSTANPNPADARAGSKKSFVIFNDLNSNKAYDYATSSSALCSSGIIIQANDECIDILNITSNDTVYQICPNGANCSTSSYADITFLRPNPDAYICTGVIGSPCSVKLSSVDIIIKNDQSGDTKTISVSSVGQISVK